MVHSYLNHIEEPAHDDSTEEVLEGDEGVRDAQQQGGQLQKITNFYNRKYVTTIERRTSIFDVLVFLRKLDEKGRGFVHLAYSTLDYLWNDNVPET